MEKETNSVLDVETYHHYQHKHKIAYLTLY